MGYDIRLVRGDSKEEIKKATYGELTKGSTYMIAADDTPVTEEMLSMAITYNYSEWFGKAFGKDGIRAIDGMVAYDAAPVLIKASCRLNEDAVLEAPDDNYWHSTATNAKRAVDGLITLCRIAPSFTFMVQF